MKVKFDLPFAKQDIERRLVFGFANVAVTPDGAEVVDLQDDVIPEMVLEKAAYNYVAKSGVGGVEHETMGTAVLVESVFLTKEKVEAMGLDASKYNGAAWWVGFKVTDDKAWEAVKSGSLRAFSIGGTCVVEDND